MALARVVSFDGVSHERMEELSKRIENEQRPDDLPASEMLLLHDPEGGKALAILLFDNEDAYRTADATLNAMPADETPGSRATVGKYTVAAHVTAATA
jgi:hypothetical protein